MVHEGCEAIVTAASFRKMFSQNAAIQKLCFNV